MTDNVISQATALLLRRYDIDADEARSLLTQLSKHQQQPVADLARQLIAKFSAPTTAAPSRADGSSRHAIQSPQSPIFALSEEAAMSEVLRSANLDEDQSDELSDIDVLIGSGDSQRVGSFRFYLAEQRWEWSEAVDRMHGYEPGTITPTTELLLKHKHPDDRPQVAAVLERVVREGEPFASRHRIIDTSGQTHLVVVVGDRMHDHTGDVIGTQGFYVDITEAMRSDITNALAEVNEARAEIEQAKGLLMSAYGITAERAFDILVWRSQETNIKVREFAHRLITAVAGNLPPDTRTHIDHALLTID